MDDKKQLQVEIVSPEKTLYSGPAESIVLPGKKGTFEVLYNHAPIISNLVEGKVVCKTNQKLDFSIKGGFVEVSQNVVRVCVEEITN